MTIWINNPFDFLPGEGARLQRYGLLARALVKAGHQVVWWSSDWNHIKKARREVRECGNARMRECANGGETPRQGEADPRQPKIVVVPNGEGSVEIRLIPTMPYFKNVCLRRLLSHWLYARAWEKQVLCLDTKEKPDLIICSAPPLSTGWVMRRLCKRLACVGIIDVMDVWPETFERVIPSWTLWPLRWMAKRVYDGADGISAVGDSYLEVVKRSLGKCANVGMLECGNADETLCQGKAHPDEADPRAKPMYRCYHGIEIQVKSEKLKAKSETLGEKQETGRCQLPTANLKLVYVGNMGKGYDLGTLIEGVKELIDEGLSVSLDLVGAGEQEESLQLLAQTKKDSIRFHGVVTGAALCQLIEKADVGVVPMFANTYVAVPYKLADYVAAGLPVISSLKGETEELITTYDAGWFYEAGNGVSLKKTIRTCVELALGGGITPYRMNALRLAQENFDESHIYPGFVKWMESVVAERKR